MPQFYLEELLGTVVKTVKVLAVLFLTQGNASSLTTGKRASRIQGSPHTAIRLPILLRIVEAPNGMKSWPLTLYEMWLAIRTNKDRTAPNEIIEDAKHNRATIVFVKPMKGQARKIAE